MLVVQGVRCFSDAGGDGNKHVPQTTTTDVRVPARDGQLADVTVLDVREWTEVCVSWARWLDGVQDLLARSYLNQCRPSQPTGC